MASLRGGPVGVSEARPLGRAALERNRLGCNRQQARTLALQSDPFYQKIFIDCFSLLFYYHLNTGREVIKSL
jgi:hypothetical protein